MTYFSMPCPICGCEVDDIEATVTRASRTEHFWGAPVSVDESECRIENVPECPECGETIEPEVAADFYWDRVYA